MTYLRVGVTGTQKGMTPGQKGQFVDFLVELDQSPKGPIVHFRHGDCIGADADAHNLVRLNFENVMIIGHPPKNETKRAFCKVDLEMASFDHLVRNRMIINNSDYLVACPGEPDEQLRSGTWSTVRYARNHMGMSRIHLILP